MVTVTEPATEYHHNPTQIVVKKITIEDNKHSINLVYRLDKDGKAKVTGFDVKCYGETSDKIKYQADELILYGLQRMKYPLPEEG